MQKFAWILLSLGVASSSANADDSFFHSKVAPILQTRCLSCHNDNESKGELSLQTRAGMLKGGESGELIEIGKPGESLLIDYVSGDDPEMPQEDEPLTKSEIKVLRDWIKAGAKWPDKVALKVPVADLNWWSLKPLQKNDIPESVVNPIDFWIEKEHAARGFQMAKQADRRTLIRRLYFDLIGLPPSPEEVEQFVDSLDPQAYGKLVDRLLDSKHYGERWARHWLDVVQYGETHGYDKDKLRMNAWPYRDYVIRSFNQDKRYSRFVREQLAGDALWPDTTDGIVATGFIAAGPWDFIGHAEVPESKTDGKVARNLDRDNMVTSTMNTFCSLTVQCARCHDHKLDPVTMEQYYSLQAVFASIDRADRSYDNDPNIADRRRHLKELVQTHQKKLNEIEATINQKKTKVISEDNVSAKNKLTTQKTNFKKQG